jgi:hypothetical protein
LGRAGGAFQELNWQARQFPDVGPLHQGLDAIKSQINLRDVLPYRHDMSSRTGRGHISSLHQLAAD